MLRARKVLEALNASHRDGEPAVGLLETALRMEPPADAPARGPIASQPEAACWGVSQAKAHAISASKPPVAFGFCRRGSPAFSEPISGLYCLNNPHLGR